MYCTVLYVQFKRTALIYACERGHEEVVKVLLEHWTDYTLRDSDGTSALSAATAIGNVKILDYMLYLENFDRSQLKFAVCLFLCSGYLYCFV